MGFKNTYGIQREIARMSRLQLSACPIISHIKQEFTNAVGGWNTASYVRVGQVIPDTIQKFGRNAVLDEFVTCPHDGLRALIADECDQIIRERMASNRLASVTLLVACLSGGVSPAFLSHFRFNDSSRVRLVVARNGTQQDRQAMVHDQNKTVCAELFKHASAQDQKILWDVLWNGGKMESRDARVIRRYAHAENIKIMEAKMKLRGV